MSTETQVIKKAVLSIILLFIGYTYPVTIYYLSDILESSQRTLYFLLSAGIMAILAYFSSSISKSALSLLSPNSSFLESDLYALRLKYFTAVKWLEKGSFYLGLLSIIYGTAVTIYLS
ncbi:TPA: hypothetical protein ACX6SX_002804 [Photobacterium damselae]|uniref:hypothetical protein n=1 Tax=Photobacterium damselae TaxID=38293 RepID=UPI003D7E7CD1